MGHTNLCPKNIRYGVKKMELKEKFCIGKINFQVCVVWEWPKKKMVLSLVTKKKKMVLSLPLQINKNIY